MPDSKFIGNDWPVLFIDEDGRRFLIHEDGNEEEVKPGDLRLRIRYETFVKQPKLRGG